METLLFSLLLSFNILCSGNILSCHGPGADVTVPYKDAAGSYGSCVGSASPSLEGKKY